MADLRRVFAAFASMSESGPAVIDQLHSALERVPLATQHLKEIPVNLIENVLTPPVVDPTRRRTEGPRLKVRTVHGMPLFVLPASDPRNLSGQMAKLWCAEWEIWLIDENHQERIVEFVDSGDEALAALPRLLRELGLLNEDGTRPASEGGVFDAA